MPFDISTTTSYVDAQRRQRLVLFVIYLFEFYLFGFQTILLFMCMNNNFNNLYGSGGYISCGLTATLFLIVSAQRRECLFSKYWAESTMGCVGLLGWRLGGAAGKPLPPIRKSTPVPSQMAQKSLAPVAV
jgi:hypothetical protein